MTISDIIAIVSFVVSISSTILVFFERFSFNRRIRTLENKIAAIGTSLTR
jgi:predicted membrane protein